MGVYVDNHLAYVVSGKNLNTILTIATGKQTPLWRSGTTVVEQALPPVAITVNNQSGVWITSPANNAGVNTPVTYAPRATTTCSKGVASMGSMSTIN